MSKLHSAKHFQTLPLKTVYIKNKFPSKNTLTTQLQQENSFSLRNGNGKAFEIAVKHPGGQIILITDLMHISFRPHRIIT